MRLLVEGGRDVDRLVPGRGRVHVDLDHARIGRHLDDVEARIDGRRIALDVDGEARRLRRLLDRGDERRVVLGVSERRHEHAEMSVARLDRHRRAHRPENRPSSPPAGRRRIECDCPAALHEHLALGQRRRVAERVARQNVRIVRRRQRRQRPQRQAEAGRRIAGHEEQLVAPQRPALRHPAPAAVRVLPDLDRQHVARPLRRRRGRTRARCARARRDRRACWSRP